MDKKRRSRLSVLLFKRHSKIPDLDGNTSNKKISTKKLYETFKESPIDFNILHSMIKLSNNTGKTNADIEQKNELVKVILDNMKKKNLFFFFLNFYKINDDLLKKIIPHLNYEHYLKGGHLFNENDFSTKFFFIIKGFITFHRNEIIFDEDKNSSIVDVEKFILGPDNYFGEIDLIYDKKKSMSAFCKTECHLITLNKKFFKKFVEERISKTELEKKLYIISFFKKFSRIPNVRLEKYILSNVQTLFFRRNKIIYKSGENNNSLYLIYRGEAIIINDINQGEFSYLKNFNERIGYMQKKALGLNYIEIIKNTNTKSTEKKLYDKEYNIKNIDNERELDDLNLLMNKMKYDIVCQMTKGSIGGLEIVTGVNQFKYSLIANSDFTCVLKLELKNIDDYLTDFLINLIPLYVEFEKNIHERIKNFKLIDENITPSSVKKLKKNKNKFFDEEKEGEENDKIYKKKIQKIDDSFQLNYGGFIKNNNYNYNLYQKKEHYKELLKNNKKKILQIEKFLKYLDSEEKLNLKFTEFKLKNSKNLIYNYKSSKNTINNITRQSTNKLKKKSKKNIMRLFSTKSIYKNLKINVDSNLNNIDTNKVKKPKLTWKFVDSDKRLLRKKEDKKHDEIKIFKPKIFEEEKNKKKDLNILYEKRSLSIDDDYKQKVFFCSSPKNKIRNRYKTKELLVLTPRKNKTINNKYYTDQKQFLKRNNIRIIKKVFLYDTGKFDIPLLSDDE